jgi:outer membrane protein
MRIIITLCIILFTSVNSFAQQKWDLKKIVEYAMTNNINAKINDVQAKQAAISYAQSKLAQYPNASFSANAGINSGNNQDPTTFSRITQTFFTSGMQLQTSADIFNFYAKRNTILANEFELKAAAASSEKIRNDIALSAANAYLQALLSKEQEKIAIVQIEQTNAQLSNTRKMVKAGSLPELNATILEVQLAQDSLNYITTKGNSAQALLSLKAFMNMGADMAFDIETPAVENIPVEPIADLQPEYVYNIALKNLPQQKYNDLKLKAAEKNVAVAKANMLPKLGGYGTLGTNYNNRARSTIGNNKISGLDSSSSIVKIGPLDYKVLTPFFYEVPITKNASFGKQLSGNFSQSIGINVSIPIFNGGTLKSNYARSKLNIETINYQKEQDNQKLKQDIYQAYNSALVAYEKFNASKKAIIANELSLNYATKRFNVGMLNTYDLITTQNNLLRSKLQFVQNQFEYVFKIKVLEFYKGMGLKL